MQLKILIVAIVTILSSLHYQKKGNNKFKITIERKLTSDNCIQGYLSVNDSAICYTMELPYRGNLNYLSSIPKGKYEAFIRTDKAIGWRIELVGVPKRDSIQIHLGNYTSDITGCILVGKVVRTENCTVEKSKDAIKEIEKLFKNFKADLCLNCNSSQKYDIEVEYK